MGDKLPSPCIDVCKFKREGHCIGCSMTKKQKKSYKRLSGKKKRALFVIDLFAQQKRLGKYSHWLPAYQRKCKKKGVEAPVG